MNLDWSVLYAPFISYESTGIIPSFYSAHRLNSEGGNVSNAYFYERAQKSTSMEQPNYDSGIEDQSGMQYQFKKSLYGISKAVRKWVEVILYILKNLVLKVSSFNQILELFRDASD